jgi:hypothetical protein
MKFPHFAPTPTWTRLVNTNTVFTLGGYVRHDGYNYYPSDNPFADLTPLQQESVAQTRTLTNAGAMTYVSYVKGIHNVKAGATYQQTFLTENDRFGIVDPSLIPSLDRVDSQGNSIPGSPCFVNNVAIAAPCTTLLPYDLTRSGTNYLYHGHTDVKQLALYIQDTITYRNWAFNLGIRGDLYNGLAIARQAEPRLGAAYNFKRTNTVLRASYARIMETPFNENLVSLERRMQRCRRECNHGQHSGVSLHHLSIGTLLAE